MSADSFDPYFKWLGISPKDQPPSHYRLLGIDDFTDDGDVISNAADRQMMLVRTFQSGQHAALSQQILNELSQARNCLLDSRSKSAYDLELKARKGTPQFAPIAKETFVSAAPPRPAPLAPMTPPLTPSSQPPQTVPMNPPVMASTPNDFGLQPTATGPQVVRQRSTTPVRKGRKQDQANAIFWIVGGGVGAVLLLVLLLVISAFLAPSDGQDPASVAADPNASGTGQSASSSSSSTASNAGTTGQEGADSLAKNGVSVDWRSVGSRDWVFSGEEISAKLEMQPGSWLMTQQQFADCAVTFEYVVERGGAGGLYLRVPVDATWPWNQGLEVHFKDDNSDSKITHESTGAIWHRTPPTHIASRPVDQWNQVRVECRGRDISVEINGDHVCQFRMNDRMPSSGHIGLDGVSGGITYRNLRVKELK